MSGPSAARNLRSRPNTAATRLAHTPGHVSAHERSLAVGKELENLLLERRRGLSRPSSAASRMNEDPQTWGIATRPSSAASAVQRSALFGDATADQRVLSALEDSLATSVDLSKLKRDLAHGLDTEVEIKTPLDRYNAFRNGYLETVGHTFPCVGKLCAAIFVEADKAVSYCQREMSTSATSVARCAMKSAIEDSARVQRESEAKDKRIQELTSCVDELTATIQRFEAAQRRQDAFIDDIRLTLADCCSKCGWADDVTPLTPDATNVDSFRNAAWQLAAEVEQQRAENSRLADVASRALEQHAHMSNEIAQLLDRANGFQQQVGQMKTTMKVMKAYIEDLEKKVFELSDADDRAAAEVLRCKLQTEARQSTDLNNVMLETVCWQSLVLRGTIEHDRSHATSTTTDAPNLPELAASIRGEFGREQVPSHLRQHAIPNLRPRPFDNAQSVADFVSESFIAFEAAHTAMSPGAAPSFDSWFWEYCLRKAPGGNPKAAAEMALSVHHYAKRFCRLSVSCYYFWLAATNQLAGTVAADVRVYLNVLRRRLQECEPASKRARDRISRANFIRAVGEVLPLSSTADLSAIAQFSVVAQDGKHSDDVQYDAFFDQASAGATLVHDALCRLICVNGQRMVQSVVRHLLKLLTDDEEQRRTNGVQDRLTAVGAEVRRMMKLGEPRRHPVGTAMLADVENALRLADPQCTPALLERRLMAVARSQALDAATPGTSRYDELLTTTFIHVDEVGVRLRKYCFMLPTTAYWPLESPESVSSA